MANFSMDPRPHAPPGFEVLPHQGPSRLYSYIAERLEVCNNDLTIAFFTPAISKRDFEPMSAALNEFFYQQMGVRLAEVQPSPIGDGFVRFSTPVERERFLDRIIEFGPEYQLRFIKHDEGINVREHDLDREVWIMLMLFPNDARNNICISKAISRFGLLRYWLDTKNNARIPTKVHLNDEARIPNSTRCSCFCWFATKIS
ncbi:hypothetical protein C2845_PM08G14400 [Panicum miliaceum]|uniref:DUF7597 domain-containing protein n=1 Tax=Panicum miliaceum TaxID=4540 RepID=A0A3L6R2R5_PANMI|nr:hypothetical protein C2845_PM08G14400 [Panicum miliaceum]